MIDEELKKRAWNPEAKSHKVPREKVVKVGKMITDVIDHKFGKITTQDAEYWGLEALLTDEMCDIMLAMGLRKPHTVPELWKLCNVAEEGRACWNTTTAITMTTTAAPLPSPSGGTSYPCSCRVLRNC